MHILCNLVIIVIYTLKLIDRWTDKLTYTNEKTEGTTPRQTNWKDKQTDRNTKGRYDNRQMEADRQTDRQTDGHIDRQTILHID